MGRICTVLAMSSLWLPLCLWCLHGSVSVRAEAYELPASVQKKIDEHNKRIAEIVREAKQDIQKQQVKVVGQLEKELRSETRKGDFANAQAITKLIAEIKQEDDKALSLFGDNLLIEEEKPRIRILKVAFVMGDVERQGALSYDFIKHVEERIAAGVYEINFHKEFASELPEGFTYNKAWIDYTLDDGPKVYLEAQGAEFTVRIPEPAPIE